MPSHARWVASCLLVLASTAGACPDPAERQTLVDGLLSRWEQPTAGPAALDYASFLDVPGHPGTCLVLVSRSQGHAHADGATVGIVELTAQGSTWTQTFQQPDAIDYGSFGKAPRGRLLKLDSQRSVLAFDVEGMHVGRSGTTLVLLARIGDRYREILNVRTHGDNAGSGEDASWEWNGRLRFDAGGRAFPDLRVSFSGTEEHGGVVRAVARVEHYRFVGDAYRKAP